LVWVNVGLVPDASDAPGCANDDGARAEVAVATPFDEIVAELDALLLGLRTPG
jgi:hypothetical protein